MSRFNVRACLLCLGLGLLVGARPAWAQQRDITGRVTTATGEALPGTSVTVVGTALGAITDGDGRFSLSVPAADVILVFQNIGYGTREVRVPADQSTVSVQLDVDVLALDELVVTGQATSISRRNLANAVATVSAAEIERVPAQTVERLMQGRVAGALIESNSGAPGGGMQVRLRGVSTINGETDPLFVIDGIVMSNEAIASNTNAVTEAAGGSNASNQDGPVNRIADLNPYNIASIEILKGASAAALYGSRAANGVVIITTKSGRPGETRIDVTQRFGVYDVSNKLGSRSFETVEEAFATFLDSERSTAADTANLRALYGDGQAYDYEEMLFGRNDLSTETAVSVSGGSDNTQFYVSGLIKNDEAVLTNSGYEKQALRVNLDQRLGDRWSLAVNSSITHAVDARGLTNNDNSGTSIYMVLPFTPNFVDLRPNADGTFPTNPFERSNPLQTASLMQNEEENWRLVLGSNLSFDAIRSAEHNLRFLATAGADFFSLEQDQFYPPELEFEPADEFPGTSLLSNSQNLDITLHTSLVHTYTPSAGGLRATTSAGLQYEDRDLNIARIVSRGLIAGQPSVDAGTNQQVLETRQRVKDLGIYAQEEVLMLDDRLLLTAGLRADRSSTNGDTEKYFLYPKAAASYRFDALPGFLDGIKLRTAWGQSGNQPLFGQKFTALDATNNIGGIPGLVVGGTAGDADIEPERTTEIEGGFDLTAFDGDASLEVTGFFKTVENLLLQRTPAPSSGFIAQFFNGGAMQVRGLEVGLQAVPVGTDDFTWISRTTFYADRSEITELPVPAFEVGGFGTGLGAFRVEEGASATQIVANAGLDGSGNVIVRQVGDATPDFRMGFSNDFTLGDFNLFTLVDWSQGQEVINLTQFLIDAGANSVDYDADPQDFTLPDGTVIPDAGLGLRRLLTQSAWQDTRPYIEDASYIKVREVALTYNLPDAFVGSLFGGAVDAARLTLSGRNLLTITDYTGLDPEVSNFGNQAIARNIDVAPYPPSRSFWVSVDVSF